jgi:glycine/D-amino acid oxidase-like deaminating enzyme
LDAAQAAGQGERGGQDGRGGPGATNGRTLWSAVSPPPPPAPALAGELRADVAVVGAGILGLSLALHLAEAGVRVALLEAGEIGAGASGRNTGFVVPSFPGGHDPESVAARLGAAQGEQLARLAGGSAALVFETIRRHAIDCDGEQTGWLQPAHTPALVDGLAKRVRAWQALGQPVALLDRAETQRLTGNPRYLGALLDRSGGQLNPLAYARGLARAAAGQGAALHCRSAVRSWHREAGGWRLTTEGGSVLAQQVFFTTNALAGRLLPGVARSLIAVRPYQVATQPLDPALRARLLPERQPVSDLHRHTFAYRLSADHRLVTGGIAMRNDAGATARMAEYFLRRLHRYLPGLPPLQAAFAWRGVIAVTSDFLPALWQVEPGVFAPIGCNGRGVAMTTALGRAIAAHVASQGSAALPLPVTAARPRPLHGLLSHAPSAWLAWNRWRDARDDRSV